MRMTRGRALSEQEFKACFAEPMQNVTANPGDAINIWPYVDALDLDDLCVPSLNDVHYVYRDAHSKFDQILVGTGRFNTLLVVVVDLEKRDVLGHRLLDLNREYATSGGHLKPI